VVFRVCYRKRTVKNTVWNIAPSAAETWTLTKASQTLLEASELWIWQRTLKITWKKINNKEMLLYVMKPGLYWKQFTTGSIIKLSTFSDMKLYSTILHQKNGGQSYLWQEKNSIIKSYNGEQKLCTTIRISIT